jgi:hypothetical protein
MNRILVSLSFVCAASVVLVSAPPVHALSLVVMAYNNNLTSIDPTLAGYTAYEIGVKFTSFDVAAGTPPGSGSPLLGLQNLMFVGDGSSSPYQSPDSVDDVQSVQSQYINPDSKNAANQVGPSNKSGPDVNLGVANSGVTQEDLFTDSWWFSGSASGVLRGIFNSNAQMGTITTNNAADHSGVYAIGQAATSSMSAMGTLAVGKTGYVWGPEATGLIPDSGTGTTMEMGSAFFGPIGANYVNPSAGAPFSDPNHILGDMLVANGGTLTVPLAQIVANHNVHIPSAYDGGGGTFLLVGAETRNVLGGPVGTDPGAFLSIADNAIVPEPSTLILAALGLALLAWRSSVKLRA